MRLSSKNAVNLSVVGFLTVLTTICGTGDVAHASTFNVDSKADTIDAIPGNGACNDGVGNCSLRAAIMEANALVGADTIDVPAGTYILTIPGDREDTALTGDLDITDNLTITGAGETNTIIDGGGTDRVLEVIATSSIADITIQNGSGSFETAAGAGIYNASPLLTLNNVTIIGNQTGIYNDHQASTVLADTSVIGNSPYSGIINYGTVEIRNSAIQGNTSADWGGGIKNLGTMTIDNSLISGNSALGDHAFADVGGFGGGIHVFGWLTISNTTISGNTAEDNCWGGCRPGKGGGIYIASRSPILEHVTITKNHASIHSGVFLGGAGGIQLKSTIIANNSGGDNCGFFGDVTNLGHNLDSGNSCGFISPSDLVNTDPLLGPLQDNGGPTFTHALLPGSPAIDHILPVNCIVTTDQRGISRPQGDACDIGAYELDNISKINPGLNDAWYNPETSGQGFFITVFPGLGAVSLAWFTYDTELPPMDAIANLGDAGHRWLTAVGPIEGNQAIMEIEMTSGGLFDTATLIDRTDPPGSDGTIILTFTSCNSATVEYDIPSINKQGIVPIQRVANDNIVICEALSTD